MTRKFKNAVESVVFDGIITSEEKELLKKIAKEENVLEKDAEIYIIRELKKRKVKIENPGNWFTRNSEIILGGIFSIGGIALKFFLDGKNAKPKS